MSEAIFGLVGVAVGALVTGWTEWALGRSQQRTAARSAGRLLGADLIGVWVALIQSVGDGVWQGARTELVAQTWSEHRAALAGFVTDDEMNLIATAVYVVDLVETDTPGAGKKLTKAQTKDLTETADTIFGGATAALRVKGLRPWWSRAWHLVRGTLPGRNRPSTKQPEQTG